MFRLAKQKAADIYRNRSTRRYIEDTPLDLTKEGDHPIADLLLPQGKVLFRNPKPKPETRNPRPETRNPKPETRNPRPGQGRMQSPVPLMAVLSDYHWSEIPRASCYSFRFPRATLCWWGCTALPAESKLENGTSQNKRELPLLGVTVGFLLHRLPGVVVDPPSLKFSHLPASGNSRTEPHTLNPEPSSLLLSSLELSDTQSQ